ncbi:hypothetical protein JD844_028177 [Phrynosoma platyrhinos]|uniref:Solute carrier family 5 member 8 n=1 Tax=Phrynosoma platyrhinos TaxID=52577 RepID=A0ABQ7SHU1_PHRPL|nr:hypothetical protein JD844_028177 [Phrynosoma platyrhinos]
MGPCRSLGGFGVWDYLVFAAMLLISAGIGVYYAVVSGQETSKDFLMGGRRMTALPVALSLTASFMSAVTVLGTPAEVYRFGAMFSLFALTYALVVILSAEVFLPVFYRLGITNIIHRNCHLCSCLSFKSSFSPDPLQRHTFWTIVVGGTFTWLSIYGVSQSQVQRYIACKTRFQAKLTVSSSINALAAVTVEDLIKPYFTSLTEKKLSWISKGMSLFYGGVCIAMAALASLLGGLLQAALSIFGMVGGPLLGLFSLGILCPFANPVDSYRPVLADYWYSLSYLYFSTLGTLVTIVMGLGASLLTGFDLPNGSFSGGLRQTVDRKFMLTKEDFLSNFSCLKPKKEEKVRVLTWKPFTVKEEGTDNPAFNHIEMNLTDSNEKFNGVQT